MLTSEQIEMAVAAVRRGELVVLPTDTVYGIGADAASAAAVDRLLTAKGRGRDKPSPVLVDSPDTAARLAASIPDAARAMMDALWPGALTVVLPARPNLGWDLGETNGTVALRMPDSENALALLRAAGPMAVSSANLTGHEPALEVEAARAQLGDRVAVYLDGGRVPGGVPSTIVRVLEDGRIAIIRHGALEDAVIAQFGELA